MKERALDPVSGFVQVIIMALEENSVVLASF